jgi:DNA repair protein RadC
MIYKYKLKLVKDEEYKVKDYIESQDDIKEILSETDLVNEPEEVSIAIALSHNMDVLGIFEISRGQVDFLDINYNALFKRLFVANASAFILVHQHPAGELRASEKDIETTIELGNFSSKMGIHLLDHIIMSGQNGKLISMKEKELF